MLRVPPARQVLRVTKDHLVLLVPQDLKASQVLMALLEQLVQKARPALKVIRDHLGLRVPPDHKGRQVLSVALVLLDPRVPLVLMASRGQLAQLGHKESKVLLVLQGPLVLKVRPAILAPLGLKEPPGRME